MKVDIIKSQILKKETQKSGYHDHDNDNSKYNIVLVRDDYETKQQQQQQQFHHLIHFQTSTYHNQKSRRI